MLSIRVRWGSPDVHFEGEGELSDRPNPLSALLKLIFKNYQLFISASKSNCKQLAFTHLRLHAWVSQEEFFQF